VLLTVEKSVDSDMVISCIDDFVKTIKGKTVIVMDNASIHHSKKFNAKLGEWITKGLRIFHLSPYSPHLNIIETLWRKIKYKWLKPEDYDSWETLIRAVEKILNSVGKDLKIVFGELAHFKKFKKEKVSII
jgi:transposase